MAKYHRYAKAGFRSLRRFLPYAASAVGTMNAFRKRVPMKSGGGIVKRSKLRHGFAPVRTRTKNKTNTAQQGLDGVMFSKCVVTRKPSTFAKGWKALTNQNMYQLDGAGTIFQNTSGLQAASLPIGAGLGSQMRAISQQVFGTGVTGYRTNKLMCNYISAETRFVNQTSAPCRLTLYDIEVLRDISNSQTSGFNPIATWDTGLQDSIEGLSPDHTILAGKPNDSPMFRQYFRVIGTKKTMLHSGGYHIHKVFNKTNRIFNYEQVRDLEYLRKFTHFTIAVVEGMPANDSINTTNVATNPVKVDYVTSYRIKWQSFSANGFYYVYSGGQQVVNTPHIMSDVYNVAANLVDA